MPKTLSPEEKKRLISQGRIPFAKAVSPEYEIELFFLKPILYGPNAGKIGIYKEKFSPQPIAVLSVPSLKELIDTHDEVMRVHRLYMERKRKERNKRNVRDSFSR